MTPATRFDNLAYERELIELVHELDLEDAVIFLGERPDVSRVLATLDVLLVPIHRRAVRQDRHRGTRDEGPDRCDRSGGPPEVIRWGLDGFFFPPVISPRGRRRSSSSPPGGGATKRGATPSDASAQIGTRARFSPYTSAP